MTAAIGVPGVLIMPMSMPEPHTSLALMKADAPESAPRRVG
jgi:hypothetical protein